MSKPKTTQTTATTASPAGNAAETLLPPELHGIAVRLVEARRLRDLAETATETTWQEYQAGLRQNTANPESLRARWDHAGRDRDSRKLAVELLEGDLAAALGELTLNRSKHGSPLRDAIEADHGAHVAAEAERRAMIAEAVELLDRALAHGNVDRGLPRQDAAEAELAALARLLPEELAAPVLARAYAPRPIPQGCSLTLREAMRYLRGCLT